MRKYALLTFFSFTFFYISLPLRKLYIEWKSSIIRFSFFLQEISIDFRHEVFPWSFHWLPPAFISIGSEIIGLTRLIYRVFFSKQHQANFLGGGKMAFPVCHQSCNPIWAFPVCHVVASPAGVPVRFKINFMPLEQFWSDFQQIEKIEF